jgi:hypothetical protein
MMEPIDLLQELRALHFRFGLDRRDEFRAWVVRYLDELAPVKPGPKGPREKLVEKDPAKPWTATEEESWRQRQVKRNQRAKRRERNALIDKVTGALGRYTTSQSDEDWRAVFCW